MEGSRFGTPFLVRPHVVYFSAKNITLNDNDGFVIRTVLYNETNHAISPTAIFLPDKMKQTSNSNYGNATIESCSQINDTTYSITLSATKIVPVLWLDINPVMKDKYQLKFWFSDNGFTMTEPVVSVNLKIFSSNGTVTLTAQDLLISRMGLKPAGQNPQTTASTNPQALVSSSPLTSAPTSKPQASAPSNSNRLSVNVLYSILMILVLYLC